MNPLNKRLEKLEQAHNPISLFDDWEYILTETAEQHHHPERFNKVLDHEDNGEKWYKLERKVS